MDTGTPLFATYYLLHQVRQDGHEARALDGGRELALVPHAHTRALARHDLAEGRQVTAQHVGIFVVDGFDVLLAERALPVDRFWSRHSLMILKWDIFDANLLIAHPLVHGSRRIRRARSRRGRALRRAIQDDHVLGYDFGALFLGTVLRFPFAGLQATFDVDFAALGQVLLADVSQLAPSHDGMVLGALLLLPLGVGPLRGSGHREVAHALAARSAAALGIPRQVPDDHCAIEIHKFVS